MPRHAPLAFSICLGALALGVAILAWRSRDDSPARRAELDALAVELRSEAREERAAITARLERLEAELEATRAALAAREAAEPESPRSPYPVAPADGAADENLARSTASKVEPAPDPREADAIRAEEERGAAIDDELGFLADPSTPRERKRRALARLLELGGIARAIEELEAAAVERPHDPDARVTLGDAYIQKLLKADFLEQGRLSMKANAAYDAALALDERHWDARFSKAVNWSFAPPVLGFQEKAIAELETLRAQQEGSPPDERFAQTYLLLGNLYSARGHLEKAGEARARAAELYPDARSWLDQPPPGAGDPAGDASR